MKCKDLCEDLLVLEGQYVMGSVLAWPFKCVTDRADPCWYKLMSCVTQFLFSVAILGLHAEKSIRLRLLGNAAAYGAWIISVNLFFFFFGGIHYIMHSSHFETSFSVVRWRAGTVLQTFFIFFLFFYKGRDLFLLFDSFVSVSFFSQPFIVQFFSSTRRVLSVNVGGPKLQWCILLTYLKYCNLFSVLFYMHVHNSRYLTLFLFCFLTMETLS